MLVLLVRAELRRLFLSPLAWIVLACVSGLLAWLGVVQLWGYERLSPKLALLPEPPGLTAIVVSPVLETAALLLIPVAALLAMRGFADDRRRGTMDLLMTAPVSVGELVVSKFLAYFTFNLSLVALIALSPAALRAGAVLDFGLVTAGLLALIASASLLSSVAVLASCLSARPPVAGALALVALVGLWVSGGSAAGDSLAGRVLGYASMPSHLRPMLSGVVDTHDLGYFVIGSAVALSLAIARLGALRTDR